MSLFSIEGLTFSYGRHTVLKRLNLTIEERGVVALLGANGSGKTTLLKLLMGLLKPLTGKITLKGKNLADYSRRELAREVAYVPQTHREAFGYTALEVVLMGRTPHRSFLSRYGASDERIAWEALERMGVERLAFRPYTEISGGERQLVLVARALAQQARVFIMDEPTNALDFGNQVRLLERVAKLADDGYSFIMTTHHPEQALSIADRVVTLQSGSVLHDGTPDATVTRPHMAELYSIPQDLFQRPQTSQCGIPMLRQTRDTSTDSLTI